MNGVSSRMNVESRSLPAGLYRGRFVFNETGTIEIDTLVVDVGIWI